MRLIENAMSTKLYNTLIDSRLNESDTLKEIPSEIYQYMFENMDYDVDRNGNVEYVYVPTYEEFNDSIAEISEDDFLRVRNEVEQALYSTKFYNDSEGNGAYIELSDNHTMWELENENKDIEEWSSIVQAAAVRFENETGVELKFFGRSGRHACVDINAQNILNYNKLQEVQARLEREAVEEFNSEDINESVLTEDNDYPEDLESNYDEDKEAEYEDYLIQKSRDDRAEDVARDLAIEPSSDEEAQLNDLYNAEKIEWTDLSGSDQTAVEHYLSNYGRDFTGKSWNDVESEIRSACHEIGAANEELIDTDNWIEGDMDPEPNEKLVMDYIFQNYFLPKDKSEDLNEAEKVSEEKKVTKVEVLVLPTIKFLWAEGNQDHIKALFGSAEEHDMDFSKFQNAVYVLDQEVSERDGGYDKVKYIANIQVKFTYEDESTSEETTTYTGRVDCGDGYKYVTVSKNMKYTIQDAYKDAEVIVKEDDTAELKESEVPNKMTMAEYALRTHNGILDGDVTDTEIDMLVYYFCDFKEEPTDNYERLMKYIGEHTYIDEVKEHVTICDFSSLVKPFNEAWKELFNMEYSEFNEDEAYYECVANLEPIIAGNVGDKFCGKMLDILQGK